MDRRRQWNRLYRLWVMAPTMAHFLFKFNLLSRSIYYLDYFPWAICSLRRLDQWMSIEFTGCWHNSITLPHFDYLYRVSYSLNFFYFALSQFHPPPSYYDRNVKRGDNGFSFHSMIDTLNIEHYNSIFCLFKKQRDQLSIGLIRTGKNVTTFILSEYWTNYGGRWMRSTFAHLIHTDTVFKYRSQICV